MLQVESRERERGRRQRGRGHRRATREGVRRRAEVRAPPRCARVAALSVSGDREKEGGRGREVTRGERGLEIFLSVHSDLGRRLEKINFGC